MASARSSPTRWWARWSLATARCWARAGTKQFGGAHAEVNAIEACGVADLSGATLYVSLEPCCHEGKTPPCTEAILQAGIGRVVVASDDPDGEGLWSRPGNPARRGRGGAARRQRARGARAAAQPGLSQARPRRAAVGAVQVRDDARRQGRDSHRRLPVDQRRGQPRAGPPLARLGRRGGRGHRHGAGG